MFALAFPIRWSSHRRHRPTSWFAALRSIDVQPWNICLFLLVAACVIGYLALANANATAGYEVRALESTASALRDETRRLELATIDAQSLKLLESRIADRGYIPVASIQFLTIDHAVAQR